MQVLAAVGLDPLRPLHARLVELAATGQQVDDPLVDLGRADRRPLESIGTHLFMLMYPPDCCASKAASRDPAIASPPGASDRRAPSLSGRSAAHITRPARYSGKGKFRRGSSAPRPVSRRRRS